MVKLSSKPYFPRQPKKRHAWVEDQSLQIAIEENTFVKPLDISQIIDPQKEANHLEDQITVLRSVAKELEHAYHHVLSLHNLKK